MTLWLRLIAHLLVTLARLARPGGFRAVAAESLAVKHQLLIMKRSQRRSPNLTAWDRLILGFCTLLVSPRRLGKIAVVLKTSTLLRVCGELLISPESAIRHTQAFSADLQNSLPWSFVRSRELDCGIVPKCRDHLRGPEKCKQSTLIRSWDCSETP